MVSSVVDFSPYSICWRAKYTLTCILLVFGNKQPLPSRASTSTQPKVASLGAKKASPKSATSAAPLNQNNKIGSTVTPTTSAASPAMPSAWDNWDDSF